MAGMGLRYTYTRLLVERYPDCFRFYRDVLGFEPGFGDESSGYADFATGDTTLALFDRSEMAQAVGTSSKPADADIQDRIALIFGVDSVDQTYADLTGRGVTFITEPADRPEWGIRVAHFRDPAGNLIEIYHSLDV
jgi:catechol 2,3-dioxygenase-like lactoylglutathione lyase family enzyme